ncbi:protein of unknown function [Magnetospirillum sp. XM-1]|uniref:hypothetical protein n=1 Tax=Magnetospirillum sp. XM-1 TaxID=1663591 RepID=UPI00073E0EC1|nr:hypothetical protein [Magnetospirillum sp. XM-1]CUW40576.1 protein of unknown function [Magnetospirillum sp. XM-1]
MSANLPTNSAIYASFVADSDSNALLLCASPDGCSWGPNIDIADQTTLAIPDLAVFNSQFWVSFVASNGNNPQVLLCSSPDGVNWSNNMVVGGQSFRSPRLTVFNGRLWLAYADTSSDLWVGSSPDGVNWTPFYPVNQSTWGFDFTSFNGQLYIVFITSSSSQDLLVCSSPDGINWSGNTPINQSSLTAPAVAVLNGQMVVAFVANSSSNELLTCISSDGVNWSGNHWVDQTTAYAPTLTAFNNLLWVGFRADSDSGVLLQCSSADGINWSSNGSIGQTGQGGPTFLGVDIQTGTLTPKYIVTSVIYAPPGSAAGTASSVSYSQGSQAGTTVSTGNSFQQGYSVTAGVDTGAFSAEASFGCSSETSSSSSVSINKSTTFTIDLSGPNNDGIDHQNDGFYLWLNPLLNIYADSFGDVQWLMSVAGATMQIVWVQAGWLLQPGTMPQDVQQTLDAAGLTPTDYAAILSTNPFMPGGTIDPNRYLLLNQTFTYEAGSPTESFTLSNSETQTQTQETSVTYSVDATVKGGEEVTAAIGANFEWTNSSSTETESETDQTATFTINPPSSGYDGPVMLYVYWDNVYQSFAFSLEPLSS